MCGCRNERRRTLLWAQDVCARTVTTSVFRLGSGKAHTGVVDSDFHGRKLHVFSNQCRRRTCRYGCLIVVVVCLIVVLVCVCVVLGLWS